MAQVELIMPKMGESVHEATITKWLKTVGEKIQADEAVLEIATDKVDSEIPSSESGIIEKLLYNVGDVVKVGSPIAIINTISAANIGNPVITSPSKHKETAINSNETNSVSEIERSIFQAPEKILHASNIKVDQNGSGKFYSPLVRSIAKKENITEQELAHIRGTSNEGRINKNDILNYLSSKKTTLSKIYQEPIESEIQVKIEHKPIQIKPSLIQAEKKTVISTGGEEIIEMDRMRKLIADHMVLSKKTSPHVTSFVEADVTNLVNWRNKIKDEFLIKEGEKITLTPIFVEAVIKAIKEFPMINSSVDGSNIILKKKINIGIATALPNGNLIVPVIKNADYMNMVGLTKTINDLVNRARINKLQPDEIQGGTFTITNLGSFGNVMGTPIINQPQAAILGIGVIKKKPAVIETPQGDTIGIRQMMFLSLSYDHRIIDGALGGSFLRKIADILELFDNNRKVV